MVVVAADDVETPFLIAADVFRRGAATARATIVPRRAGSGAVALPLVVATVTKQLCELVRAKDAILERRRRKRGRVRRRSLVFFFLDAGKEKKRECEGKKRGREKRGERDKARFFVLHRPPLPPPSYSRRPPPPPPRPLRNRIPSLSLSFSLSCNTRQNIKTNPSLKDKNKKGKHENVFFSPSFLFCSFLKTISSLPLPRTHDSPPPPTQ